MRETRQMYAPNIKRRRIFFYLVNSRNQICVPKLLCCTCIMSDGKGKSVYYYNLPVNKALQMLQIGSFCYAKTRDKIMIYIQEFHVYNHCYLNIHVPGICLMLYRWNRLEGVSHRCHRPTGQRPQWYSVYTWFN